MPVVRIAVLEGSSDAQRRDMIAKVTDALVESLSIQPSVVRVLIEDVAAQNWGVAGVALKDRESK